MGLSGNVSLSSGGSGGAEVLFSVGCFPSGQCIASGTTFTDYTRIFGQMPDAVALTADIVKGFNTGTQVVAIDVNLSSPLLNEGLSFKAIAQSGFPNTTNNFRCYTGRMHFVSTDPKCEGQALEASYGAMDSTPVASSTPILRALRANFRSA